MKKILSLDGGGIRGVTTAHFLEMIEADLKKPLSECFDLFAGTSTGCIISGLIGIKGMSAHDVADMYNYHNSNQMMNKSKWDIKLGLVQNQPKYDGRGKWSVIKKYMGDTTLGESKNRFMAPVYELKKRRVQVFKSWHDKDVKASEVLNASSAAPCYFPPAWVDKKGYFIDGGVVANNPTLCAYAEAKKLWPDEEVKILSVGTGKVIRPIEGHEAVQFGAVEWLMHDLLGIVMDESAVDYQARQILGSNYLRVNSELTAASDDMDDCSRGNLTNLILMAQEWFEDNAKAVSDLLE